MNSRVFALFNPALLVGIGIIKTFQLAFKKEGVSVLRKMIPKIEATLAKRFGKKGVKEMIKKAAKSQGVRKVGKSVVIQTGFQVAISEGIELVNDKLLSSAKYIGKKIVSSQLSTNQKFLLRKVAGVKI